MSGNGHKSNQRSKSRSTASDVRSNRPPPDKGKQRQQLPKDSVSQSSSAPKTISAEMKSQTGTRASKSAVSQVSAETSSLICSTLAATKPSTTAQTSTKSSDKRTISEEILSIPTSSARPSTPKRLYSQAAAPPAQTSSAEAAQPLERSLSELSLDSPTIKRTNDTMQFDPPLVTVVIQSTTTMAIVVADVRAVHDKQNLPGPVALRNPPLDCNLLANVRVHRISKLPNRPHTSLDDEVKLFASTVSYAYVAEEFELIEQDKQVRTVLGLLSEVPGHSISVTSKGQRKVKRKPLQFVIPNPAKTITIPNGFVTSDIQLTSEVGTPAKVEIIQIQPEMSIALSSDTQLLALIPPRLQHLKLSEDFLQITQPRQQLGAANTVMPIRACALPRDVNEKLSSFDVTQIRNPQELNDDRTWLKQLRVSAQLLRCFKMEIEKAPEALAGEVRPLLPTDYNIIVELGSQVISKNRTILRPGAQFSLVFNDGRALPLLIIFKVNETEVHLNRRPLYLSAKTKELLKNLGENGWMQFENEALMALPTLVNGGPGSLIQVTDAEVAGRVAFCKRTEALLNRPAEAHQDFTIYHPHQTRPFRCLAGLNSDDLPQPALCGEEQLYLDLIQQSILDPSQKQAASLAAPEGATVAVRAPAGSGKTFMISVMIDALIKSTMAKRTLICTESNEAAANIAKALTAQQTPPEHIIWMRAESDISTRAVDEFGRVDRAFTYSSIQHLQRATSDPDQQKPDSKASKFIQLHSLHGQMLFRSADLNSVALDCMAEPIVMIATTSMAATVLQLNGGVIDLMICDEAGVIASSTALSIMAATTQTRRLFIVGDERQLTTSCDEVYQKLQKFGEKSLLNVLLEDPNATKTDLTYTYRFQPLLARLISSAVYEGNLEFAGNRQPHPELVNFFQSPNPFILVDCPQASVKSGVSQDNPAQRELALKVVRKLLHKVTAVKKGELTVALISAYAAARRELHEPIARLQREYPQANLSLNTVDSAQGREFDISIVLLIRPEFKGFLTNINRLTVAITRSKQVLIVIGNQSALSSNDEIGNPLTNLLRLSADIDKNNPGASSSHLQD